MKLHYLEKLGCSQAELEVLQNRARKQMDRVVERASSREETLIFSGENVWGMERVELERLRDFFQSHRYRTEVYVYFRPWKSWVESDFQQGVKSGDRTLEILPSRRNHHLQYACKLETIEQVFGEQSVTALPFHSSTFRGGCVVQDFCVRAKIPLPAHRIRRLNEGLSLDALKLLLAFRIHHGYPPGITSIIHNEMLVRRLAALSGPSLRFHSRLIMPLQCSWQSQKERMVSRFGEVFREDLDRNDSDRCIRRIEELMEYTPESLEWLSQVTGLPRIIVTSGHAAIREVADQMHHLCWHPSLTSRFQWHRMIAARRVTRWARGV